MDMANLLESVFAQGAVFRFKAGGRSMHPWIRNGDILTLAPIGRKGPASGDVMAAIVHNTENFVVHRVIAIFTSGFLLKGDSLKQVDGVFPSHKLLGRVIMVHRNGKRIRLGLGPEKKILAWISRLRCSFRHLAPLLFLGYFYAY